MCNIIFYIIIQGVSIYFYIIYIQFKAKTFKEFIPNYNNSQNKDISKTNDNSINNINSQNKDNSKTKDNSQNNINPVNKDNSKTKDNLNYISQINELKNELNEEKRKNKILLIENNDLKNKNNILNNEIRILKQYEEKIKLLQDEINKKNIEIQNIKLNNNINEDEGISSIKPGEKELSINFISMGNQEITNCSFICKNTDLFVRLEERLYKDYPQFKDYETFFEVGTNRIKRFKTLEENKIKNRDIINVFINGEQN